MATNVDGLSYNIGALATDAAFKPLGRSLPEIESLMRTVSEAKAALSHRMVGDPLSDKLRMALTAAGTGVWQWDRATGNITCDEHFAQLFEPTLSGGTIAPEALFSRIEPEDRRRLVEAARSIISRPHPLVDDFRIKRPDGEIRWISVKGVPTTAADGTVQGLIGIGHDVTESKRSTARTEALLREVTHRSKNMLALVLAMARLTAREATDIDTHLKDFSLRVAGLSASQDLIVASDWVNVDLGALAVAQIRAIARDKANRVSISGPSFMLTPEAAQTLGMILTELALNALAHGALATADGHIKLSWELTGDGDIELVWREIGGPAYDPKQPKGYSMAAVERFSMQGLKVSANFTSEEDGFTWTLSGPVENLGMRPQSHRT